MRYTRMIDDVRYDHFDSVIDVINEPVPECNLEKWEDTLTDTKDRGWYGDPTARTGKQALSIINHGWEAGLKRAEKELGTLPLPRMPHVKRRRVRRDSGDTLDIDAVYSGNLDRAWETTQRAKRNAFSGGKITLLLNFGIVANEDADNLFWRGALAALLIDTLQKTGRRVQLVCFSCTRNYADSCPSLVSSVTVKDFHHPMSIDKLIAVTAFAGFFRSVGFKMIEMQPEKVRGSLGTKDITRVPKGLPANSTEVLIDESVRDKNQMKEEMSRILELFK